MQNIPVTDRRIFERTDGLDINSIPAAPRDPMFGLTAAFKADNSVQRVNLGVGVYKDDRARPWVLPSIVKADQQLHQMQNLDHEYLPIAGLDRFLTASARLVLGGSDAERHVASLQTISGTGALSLAARFFSNYLPITRKGVYVSDPPYVNHIPIMHDAGLSTETYPYYSWTTKHLDSKTMLTALEAIPNGSVVLLQACAHNPTGVDPTRDQWKSICSIMRKNNLLPLFDFAYQGFASGDLDNDAWAIRHFVRAGLPAIFIAQSYAKNFGLYGERVGCLHVVTEYATTAANIRSQLERLQRVSISTPPAYGARLASLVLNEPELYAEWQQDLQTMATRIADMRRRLRCLLEGGASTRWQHITDQIGMFCYTGLNEAQVRTLKEIYHIYMTTDGRISISGLNASNVRYVAAAFKNVSSKPKL